jgi:hypothetical protein
VRKIVLGLIVTTAATGCVAVDAVQPAAVGNAVEVVATGSPYVRVSVGDVTALVPQRWNAAPVALDTASRGFVASPHPELWRAGAGLETGLAASWIDATEAGLPSDVYYMAATGPLLSRLVESPGCRAMREEIFADHVPEFIHGAMLSPGDYVARAEGVCAVKGDRAHRWSYFVAAPGFGPARAMGIPASGLYVAVAVTRDAPGAHARLARLLEHVRFGGAQIRDFVKAVRVPSVDA